MENNYLTLAERSKHAALMLANAAPFAILIGAGAWAVYAFWRKKKARPILKRSTSLALLHGGDVALQRLIDYHEARANVHNLDTAECELRVSLIDQEQPHFRDLTRIIAKLEMSGKEDTAIGILEGEFNKVKNRKPHEAYEIEMLLVEMLIYKGDFKTAQNRKCLKDEKISDARRPLYMAIIHKTMEPPDETKAKEYFNNFIELRTSFGFQPVLKESMEETGIYKISTNFDAFEKVVDRLKVDIGKARARHAKTTKQAQK